MQPWSILKLENRSAQCCERSCRPTFSRNFCQEMLSSSLSWLTFIRTMLRAPFSWTICDLWNRLVVREKLIVLSTSFDFLWYFFDSSRNFNDGQYKMADVRLRISEYYSLSIIAIVRARHLLDGLWVWHGAVKSWLQLHHLKSQSLKDLSCTYGSQFLMIDISWQGQVFVILLRRNRNTKPLKIFSSASHCLILPFSKC